ncbi:substrate-binding periplasmic protein [Vogesella oryzae]|uniref:substrate-binding periplasmic protein n=1 Tax=Vogesella oryzae TaxID=1735285 RepID=UPI00158406BE|nr:hypothetical protein [Vogesella oryzae]
MRRLLALLVLLLTQPVLATAAPLLRLSTINQEPVGDTAAAVLQRAYAQLGIKLELVHLPAIRALAAANRGETDGDVARYSDIEVDNPQLLRVPVPIMQLEISAVTRGLAFPLSGSASLAPYRVCVRRGIKPTDDYTQDLNRFTSNSESHMLVMLLAGRCQVALLSQYVWPEVERLSAGPLRLIQPPLLHITLYHYLHQRHAALLPRITRVLQTMQRHGEIRRIVAQAEQPLQLARQRQTLP